VPPCGPGFGAILGPAALAEPAGLVTVSLP
jgi:hypothetical protein